MNNTATRIDTKLGNYSVYVTYYIGLFAIGALVYSIFNGNISGVIASTIFCLFLYFKFYQFSFRFKKITFDSNYIYVDNEQIPLDNIMEVTHGKIIYLKEKKRERIYFNHYFSRNYIKLKKLIQTR